MNIIYGLIWEIYLPLIFDMISSGWKNPLSNPPALSPDVQHLEHLGSVSWRRVPVCLLRWRNPLSQVPHPVPVLQRIPLLLVRQLRYSPGPSHAVGGLRLLLLGLQEARGYSGPSHLRLSGTGPQVRGCVSFVVLIQFVHFVFTYCKC